MHRDTKNTHRERERERKKERKGESLASVAVYFVFKIRASFP